jgi:hypothetical protein
MEHGLVASPLWGHLPQKVLFCFVKEMSINSISGFIDEQLLTTMKRNDSSSSINKQAQKKPRTLSDVRIDMPGPFDVICGRGRPYQEHHGNKRLHAIVAVHKPRYFISKRHEKKGIAEMIVSSIKNDGTQPGRFLKRTDDDNDVVWEEVSSKNAREKVSHVLRFKGRNSQPSMTEASSQSDGASGIPGVNMLSSSRQGFHSNLATDQYSPEPRHHPKNLPSRATLHAQRPVGGFDRMHRLKVIETAMSARLSEASPVNLLQAEQVFLLEALIQTRRASTNARGIAPFVRFP